MFGAERSKIKTEQQENGKEQEFLHNFVHRLCCANILGFQPAADRGLITKGVFYELMATTVYIMKQVNGDAEYLKNYYFRLIN